MVAWNEADELGRDALGKDSPRPGTKRILAVEGGVGASARPHSFPFVCDADWLHAGEPLASGFFACSP